MSHFRPDLEDVLNVTAIVVIALCALFARRDVEPTDFLQALQAESPPVLAAAPTVALAAF